MAIALVQSASRTASSSAPTQAFSSNVAAGSLLVVTLVYYSGSATCTSVTDSLNGAWTHFDAALPFRGLSAFGDPSFDCFYFANSAAGACTVTINLSASPGTSIHIREYSGAHTTAPKDTYVTESNGTSSTVQAGNLTTAEANELILVHATSGSGYGTAGSGYANKIDTAANYWDPSQDQVDSGAAGSKSTAFTLTAGHSAAAFAFKQSGGGGGGGTFSGFKTLLGVGR